MIKFQRQLRFLSTARIFNNSPKTEDSYVKFPEIVDKCGRRLIIKPVIGLEVHAQLNTRSKLFSLGSNTSQSLPNSQLDLLDVSMPGSLPILNGQAIRAAMITALGLNCKIQDEIHFDRKNYFYTDMPAGFQITQYNNPIAKDGNIDFIVSTYHKSLIAHSQQYDIVKYLYQEDRKDSDEFVPYRKRSQIKQLQLEQDSAKTLGQTLKSSDDDSDSQALNNLVDYNRSGAALVEIVFEPDLETAQEASSLVRELIIMLKMLKTCDCELQEGSLRVDANVSINSIDNQLIPKDYAARVELKNLNSLKALTKAISYEIQRQAKEIISGNKVSQESRTYETKSGQTVLMRTKESAVDYRYMPEPSIPPLRIDQSLLDSVKNAFDPVANQLPSKLCDTLISRYNLDLTLMVDLIGEPGLTEYYFAIMNKSEKEGSKFDANVVADFLIYSVSNLKGIAQMPFEVSLVKKDGEFLRRLSVDKMKKLFDMLFNDEISFAIAYEAMKYIYTCDYSGQPRQLIEQMKWFQITDDKTVEKRCTHIIGGMKNVSKVYRKRGDKRSLRLLLDKLSALNDNRVSIRKAIECFNRLLREKA